MYDNPGIESEKTNREDSNDNAAYKAKFEARLMVGERQTYAAKWQHGSTIEKAYRKEFGPTGDPASFNTEDMFGDYDFYGSGMKSMVMKELLDFNPNEFGQEEPGEHDMLAEAIRKIHGRGLTVEGDQTDGSYSPFRSEVISKLLENQLGSELKSCNICDLEEYQAMRINWGYVGSLIQKEAAVRRLELRQEQRDAEKARKKREREEKMWKRIMNDPYLSANAKYMRFEPPMDFWQAHWYALAGGQPELEGVLGFGLGSVAAQQVAGRGGGTESASIQFVMDSGLNVRIAFCGGTGVAYGSGYLVGLQISGIWGIDSICELNGIGFSPSYGGGWAVKYGISGDIGKNGANLIIGSGRGGWGASFNVVGGCKILWSLNDCESEVLR